MQYLGGKSKTRKQISGFLESVRSPGQTYFEPFVGGAWVLQEMSGKRIAGDGNDALIAMYKALQDGWVPPEDISLDEWKTLRLGKTPEKNPLQAFCRFGCGFGGDWNGGYAKPDGASYALRSRNSLLRQLPLIKDVEFLYGMYTDHSPKDMLIYCDPPYAGTTAYGAMGCFDHSRFWNVMREWSRDNTVVVSEYDAPSDFVPVLHAVSRMGLRVAKDGCLSQDKREEKLFMLNGTYAHAQDKGAE